MSKSDLEDALYEAMRLQSKTEQGLPMPERELHPFWCCEHGTKKAHLNPFVQFEYRDMCHVCFLEGRGERAFHLYAKGRNWKCDFAWPDRRLIVEVEGGVYTQGRHVRPDGFTKDIEKYNALTEAGWKVLRFSRREVKSGEALNVIVRVLREAA